MGFAVRGSEASVWFTPSGLSYRLAPGSGTDPERGAGSWVVALDLVGATPRAPVGEDPLPTKVSYFKGPKAEWRTGLPSYGSVRYSEPWPGVDVVVNGTAGTLETTFVVQPGANPGQIRLAYRGAEAVRLEADGALVVDTPLGEIREQAPVAYQDIDGRRVEVAAAFELDPGVEPGRQAYRFRLGEYDSARELIVDPVTLIYCGYLGGLEDDLGYGIAVDGAGNTYVTGVTTSTQSTFPVTVGPDLIYNGGGDVFVAKVSGDGSFLDYCGYIGGVENDVGYGIAIDSANNAYVTGFTYSTEATFPVSIGPDLTQNGDCDVFVAKIDPTGTMLLYCGYVGGTGVEGGDAIAVDDLGNAYVTGYTSSTEASFPVAIGPDLTFNGYTDAFVTKVNASGAGLDYCGYIGGSDDDQGTGIAVDFAGNAHVVGVAFSTEASFPVVVGPDLSYNGGSYDAFVAKVSSPDLIFADGFESGDTGEWSTVVPGGELSPPAETCGPGDSLGPTDTLPWSGSLDPNSQDLNLGGPGCDAQIGDDVVVCFTSSNDCMIDAACSVGSGSHTFNLFEGECTTALTPCVANIGLMDFEVTAGQTYCIVCSATDPGPVTVFLQVAPGGNACHFIVPA